MFWDNCNGIGIVINVIIIYNSYRYLAKAQRVYVPVSSSGGASVSGL